MATVKSSNVLSTTNHQLINVTGSSLTPFLCAVTTGRVEAVRLLIECGADTRVHTESLQTGFHLAVLNKHMDVLLLLLDSMGTEALEIGDKNLRVPLHFCAYSNNFKVRNKFPSRL